MTTRARAYYLLKIRIKTTLNDLGIRLLLDSLKSDSTAVVLTKIRGRVLFAYPYNASRAAFFYSATITCGSSAGLDHDKEEREHISRLGTDALKTTTTSSGP